MQYNKMGFTMIAAVFAGMTYAATPLPGSNPERDVPALMYALEQGDDSAVSPLLQRATLGQLHESIAGLELGAAAGAFKLDWYRMVKRDFDLALADPAYVIAERNRSNSAVRFAAAWNAYERQADGLTSVAKSDPARYLAEYEALLRQMQRLISSNPHAPQRTWYGRDVAVRYQALAGFVRFSVGDLPKALTMFGLAQELSDSYPPLSFPGISIRLARADAMREAKDQDGVRKLYQEVLLALPTVPPRSIEMRDARQVVEPWLRAELAWQADGARVPTMDGWQSKVQPVMQFAAGDSVLSKMAFDFAGRKPRGAEREEAARKLESLAPSHGRLIEGFPFLPVLGSPERIAAFMRKHDPAGFLSAQLIGTHPHYARMGALILASSGMRPSGWDPDERALIDQAALLLSK